MDLTKPVPRILGAELKPDASVGSPQPGVLVIRWTAEDARLASRPVSLHYSATPGGPWLAIATELDNSGRYEWSVPPTSASRLYLRLEVRDAAGNRGIAESVDPVSLAPGSRSGSSGGPSYRSEARFERPRTNCLR